MDRTAQAPRDEQSSDNVNLSPPTDASGTASATTTVETSPPPSKYLKPEQRTVVLMIGVALVGILLILRAWSLWPFTSTLVTTDNAYVRGAITVMAPQVNGYVAKVLVSDFQLVKAGEPLVQIDDHIYSEKVRQAQAQLDNAIAQLNNAEQAQAQNMASVGSAQANLAAMEAENGRAQAEQGRVEELAVKGSVSLNERDKVRANARLATANILKAKAGVDIAEQAVKAAAVSRAGLQAQVKIAEAQLALNKIDLANTVIRAPRAGQIGEASVRQGQYVSAGSQLMFLVPDTLWIIANFKENQTYRMQIGQPVSFSVDAFEEASLTGRIEQIAPATGSEFSVLRPDNASGNFTKVVQRLPVRIVIDPNQALASRLRPGMSVVVRVDTIGGQEKAP